MDENTYPRPLRPTIMRAVSEAQRRGDSSVEAEHLLLAIADDGTRQPARSLAAVGLDHAGVLRALRDEREASLRAAGLTPLSEEQLASSPRITRPRWGASARQVLLDASHRRQPGDRRRGMVEGDILVALLELQLGTVPRALELAGVDRAALIKAVAS